MTGRRPALAAVLALALTLASAGTVAGHGAGATAAASDPRSAAASSTSRSSSPACAKRPRARSSCRRSRAAARYRRGKRRGRALLARPVGGARGGTTAPSAGAASGPAGAAPSPGAPAAAGTALPATPVASGVGAEAYDFGSFVLRLTRTSVPAGNLTVYFRNYDVSEHNLWLDPPAGSGGSSVMISEALGEGEGATRTVAVTPGTWRLYCSLTGHGVMTRDLAVE